MRIVLFGKNGQVGWELQRTLAPLGDVIALGSGDLDLTDLSSIPRAINAIQPNFIVNNAAYTEVEMAEIETEKAMLSNPS